MDNNYYIDIRDLFKVIFDLEQSQLNELSKEGLSKYEYALTLGKLDSFTRCKHLVCDFPKVNAEPVVYCKDCAISDTCLIESVLIRCGSDKPFCSIGEPKAGDK